MNNKPLTAVLVGAGNRANVYASTSVDHPDKLRVVGIVDPDPVRREIMREKYGVPHENCFNDVAEFTAREKFADVVINGTMDHLHVPTSVPVLEKGYDLLLEKPFAVNEEEMEVLEKTAKKYGNKVVIGHVLRYTDYYTAIKKLVMSGEIGKIVSIEMCEHVNYHHTAVAYVRGKWRSEKLCFAPMLLAKCCHDIDILMWMMSDTEPASIASFGSDFRFGPERKPEGAGTRCLVDCPYAEECEFNAEYNYVTPARWRQYAWKALEGRNEINNDVMIESLKTDNPYGKCVWDFERDGNVDHQNVIINFKNGATGTFTMVGGSPKSERNIHIIGTKGEIKGTFEDSWYVVRKPDPRSKVGYTETMYDLKVTGDMIGAKGGHGGGDRKLTLDFIDYVNTGNISINCAELADSIRSHRVVFRADKARRTGQIVTF